MNMKIEIASLTDPGKVSENNKDAFFIDGDEEKDGIQADPTIVVICD